MISASACRAPRMSTQPDVAGYVLVFEMRPPHSTSRSATEAHLPCLDGINPVYFDNPGDNRAVSSHAE
jgi:hypothetical protein